MPLNRLFATSPPPHPPLPTGIRPLIQSYGEWPQAVDAAALLAPVREDAAWLACTLRMAQAPSLEAALDQLGLARLRNLALAAALVTMWPPHDPPAQGTFWRYGLETASAAAWLAEVVEEDEDLAFAVGLLHGIGHPVLHAAWPQAVAQLNTQVHPLALQRIEAETAALGVHHAQVSAELARRWGFADTVAEPLAWVHHPQEGGRWCVLAAIAHLAAWRVRVDLLAWAPEQAQATCPVALSRVLGIPLAWCRQRATLTSSAEALMPPMPAPAELGRALVQALA